MYVNVGCIKSCSWLSVLFPLQPLSFYISSLLSWHACVRKTTNITSSLTFCQLAERSCHHSDRRDLGLLSFNNRNSILLLYCTKRLWGQDQHGASWTSCATILISVNERAGRQKGNWTKLICVFVSRVQLFMCEHICRTNGRIRTEGEPEEKPKRKLICCVPSWTWWEESCHAGEYNITRQATNTAWIMN